MDFDLSSLLGALRGAPQQPPQPIQPTPTLQPSQGQVPLSPQAIEDMRRHAQLLQSESGHHIPLSGKVGAIRDVFAGLMGGLESGQASNALMQRRQAVANELERDPMAPPASVPNTVPGPTSDTSSTDPVSRTIQLESGGDPNSTTGSYRGLGNFSKEEERKYGITDANWQDPAVQRNALEHKQANDSKALAQHLGRTPTDAEVYLAHQQGVGGMAAHLANPDLPAWRNMRNTAEGQQKGDGWAKQAIWGNMTPQMKAQFPGGVDTVSSAGFTNLWKQRYGGSGSPTTAPAVAALSNPGGSGSPPISPQQYAQALPGQQPATTNYPQMVRQQTARLIRAGMDEGQAAAMATSMVEGNIKYQPQFSPPDDYGNVMKTVAGQPPQIHIHGSPILESYEPVKGVHQYRLKYRDPTTGVTTMQPATASGEPQGPAVALGQGSGPPAGVARAPMGAPPGATAAPSPTPQPAAPAWPQEAPGSLAGAVAPPGAVVTPPTPQAAPVAPHPGSAVAAPVAPPVATPPADFMTALGTKPPQTASLPPADTPTPAAKSPPLSPISGRPMPQGADATPDKLLEWQRGETAATKRAEAQAGELGKALAKPVEAVIQRGDVASKESRMLDTMEVLHKLTPAQLSGPYSGTFLMLSKALNELSGGAIDLGTAPAEGVDKLAVGLTTLAVREITPRPALMEFKTVMGANPNLGNTVKGRGLLIDIIRQGAKEDVALAKRASQPDVIEHPEMWTEIADQYRAEHPFKIHYDGKEYSTDAKSIAELDDRIKAEAASTGPPGIAPAASAATPKEGDIVINRKTGERQKLMNGQWMPLSVPQSK